MIKIFTGNSPPPGAGIKILPEHQDFYIQR